MKKILYIFILVSFLTFGFAVLAENIDLPDPGLTPDNPFYFLKSWKESIQTFFAFGAENKAKQFLHLAEVRLAEYQKMIEKDKTEIARKTIEKYEKQFNRALEKAGEAKEKGKDATKLTEEIGESALKHQKVLLRVLEKAPEQAREGIQNAVEMSQKGLKNAVDGLTGKTKEEMEQKAEEMRKRAKTIFESLKEKLPEQKIEDAEKGGTETDKAETTKPSTDNSIPPASGRQELPTPPGCIQVITTAISPDGKCKEFSTPCDVPTGWKKVDKCPLTATPNITVVSPNGGEVWQAGKTYTIAWKASGQVVAPVIKLKNLSTGEETGLTLSVPGDSYIWTIPNWIEAGDNYRIFVNSRNEITNQPVSDYSDTPFSIVKSTTSATSAPFINVLSPVGGEVLIIGSSHEIKWSYKYDGLGSVTLDLYQNNNVFVRNITRFTGAPALSYQWRLADTIEKAGGGYRICATLFNEPTKRKIATDCSDPPFSIASSTATAPFITVLSPNGGETWYMGKKYDISWKSSGIEFASIKVNEFKDNVSIGLFNIARLVTPASAYTGKYSWTPTDQYLKEGNQFKIIITSGATPLIDGGFVPEDQSDNYFRIISE